MKKYLVKMAFLPTRENTIKRFLSKRMVIKLSAVFLLVGIIFTACKKKELELGLSVQPQNDQLELVVSDSLQLQFYTTREDSLKIDELNGPNMLGAYVDPYFGKIKSSIISQLRISSSVDFTNGNGTLDSIVVDSVIMYLAIDGYYGNIDELSFEIYQLAENIEIDSSYYTNSIISTYSANMVKTGEEIILPKPFTNGVVDGENVDVPILRIPLSVSEFALPIINESGNTTLNGNDGDGEFVEWFKGLKITVNNNSQQNNEGEILYIDMLSDYSKISLHYRDTSGTSSQHESFSFDFDFNQNCARFHEVEYDYTGSFVGDQLADSSLGNDISFIQAQGGVKTKLAIPGLDVLIQDSNRIINKAELILPMQYNLGDPYLPAESLIITRENDEGKNVFVLDAAESGHGGEADLETKTYTFNITRYINNVLSGEYDNKPLTLITNGSGITANRTILNGFNTTNKEKPRLVLTYTNY